MDSDYITYNSPKGSGEIKGLLSKPKDTDGKLGGIVVVHENRGLNPYIKDTAKQAASERVITIAPDALSPLADIQEMTMKAGKCNKNEVATKCLKILYPLTTT